MLVLVIVLVFVVLLASADARYFTGNNTIPDSTTSRATTTRTCTRIHAQCIQITDTCTLDIYMPPAAAAASSSSSTTTTEQ